ncbi:MAG TPA: high frequency lysogenization protein HflD, partial [Gammaproteobacteria bacterium]|nr:high frequency lysogenization protein HflD [Gammaproteobacteria bacterium]
MAMAGLFQAVRLVQQTARGERRDAAATTATLRSIFNTDPETALAVYGDMTALRTGLETLQTQLGSDSARRDLELTTYAITLLHLERRLNRQPEMLRTLGDGIGKLAGRPEFFDYAHPASVAALAELYSSTISTLRPRIMVKGEQSILTGTDSRNMIRALLLGGMRAAVLWRQCGGNRVQLILGRKRLQGVCRELLEQARRDA